MGFRINTNIAAMNAHRNATQTNLGLDKSLNRLSSGLRINTAADDASGMTIADSLRSQAQGLGQAINNANDGVAVVQTADGALDEYVKIINTVRTKAIQAASDGQNADSRGAIQNDITRLLEEANNIANTTQFNGQKLLDGTFTNKSFHIGAYAGETVNLSVDNVQTNSVGNVATVNNDGSTVDGQATWAPLAAANVTGLTTGVVLKADELKVNGTDVSQAINEQDPQRLTDAKNVAAAITKATGLLATGTTKLVSTVAIGGGAITDGQVKINGVSIAPMTVTANDSDGALVSAINDISTATGVTAKLEASKLVLTADDGRNIAISGDATALGNAGLASSATTVTGTGTDILSGTTAITIASGEIIINGVDMAGTYGDGTTAGSQQTQLLNAIKDIEGLDTSSIASNKLVLTANNGDDVNIAGVDAALDKFSIASTQKLSYNSSTKGVIDIFGADKVTIGGADPATFGFTAGSNTAKSNGTSLKSIDVTSRESAEVGILISDSALKQLDATRSDLGSVQNQLESTIRNISVTQVNVTAAESQIRDVDFAAESANFAKLNILAQSGSYAMSQANAVQQNVMRLLQ